ncbi:hypothetical protein T439DRAFT_352033 [Meredithblackwellia eburnea MCA 4105]
MSTSTQVDDTSSTIAYSGNWGTRNDLAGWFGGSLHICNSVSTADSCSATMTFTGTGIQVIGSLMPDRGQYYCYVDGQTPWQWYDNAVTEQEYGNVCGVTNLTYGQHTVTFGAVAPTTLTYGTGAGLRNGITLDGYIPDSPVSSSQALGSAVWSSLTAIVAPPVGFTDTTATESSVSVTPTSTISASTASTSGFVKTTTVPSKSSPVDPGTSGTSTGSISSSRLSSSTSSDTPAAALATDLTSPKPSASSSPIGPIAGGVTAGVVVFLAVAVAAYSYRQRRKRCRKSTALSGYSYF